ncbi:hypothetical protein D3C84_1181560 [compost metagenome]
MPAPVTVELRINREPACGLAGSLTTLAVTPLSLSLALIASRTSTREAPSAMSTMKSLPLPRLMVSEPASKVPLEGVKPVATLEAVAS